MTIVVETGTGINPAANSYIDAAHLEAFAAERGYTIVTTAAALIIKSMDWLESQQFQGWIRTENQPLLFPRYGVIYRDYELPVGTIPDLLKKAQATLCLEIDRGFDPMAVITQGVKREKVDVLEVEYQDGTSTFAIRSVNKILRPLLAGGYNSAQRVL